MSDSAAVAAEPRLRNSAVVFTKPHATNASVIAITKSLLRYAKVHVVQEGDVTGEVIARDGIIDRHYATIAKYASLWKPEDLALTDETKAAFAAKVSGGLEWGNALAAGRVLNAAEAQERFGGLPQLQTAWAAASPSVKLAPGFCIGKVRSPATCEACFVINGFYATLRAKYTDPAAVVHWMLVEWDEADLTWSDFRKLKIGPTDPSVAPPTSIRGVIYSRWKQLGLPALPDVADDGVHASAGPLEGLNERLIWLGASLETDPYAVALQQAGVPLKAIEYALTNPTGTIDGCTQPLFDHLENLQSTASIRLLTVGSAADPTATSGSPGDSEDDDDRSSAASDVAEPAAAAAAGNDDDDDQ